VYTAISWPDKQRRFGVCWECVIKVARERENLTHEQITTMADIPPAYTDEFPVHRFDPIEPR
jgi:hypothetical protein